MNSVKIELKKYINGSKNIENCIKKDNDINKCIELIKKTDK